MIDALNISRIEQVHKALGELGNDVVYVGGATVSLYRDRPAGEARATDDVDVVTKLMDYKNYAEVEGILRKKGFVNDVESGIICRWMVGEITVDIMPTDEKILGFSNRWYPEGLEYAIEYITPGGISIQLFSAEYFIATKLTAFEGRGNGDGRTSSDFEDVIYVLNNRNTIWEEMNGARKNVRDYLQQTFANLLGNKYLEEWISGHLDFQERRRADYILEKIKDFVGND